ncbi:MAG: 2-phosphosulfolactate phosphatase [Candidatus Altiarchaeota archaeon]
MEVSVRSCLRGARAATGTAVIIDVFRASNTIITCIGVGVESIIVAGGLDEAHDLKRANPDYLLVGERMGLVPDGFDYNNSPASISKLTLTGRSVVFTSSAGAQGLVNAKNADRILIGSFANATALVEHLKAENPDNVSLVALGNEGKKKAVEDEECAKYLKRLLRGERPEWDGVRERILGGDGARRLSRLNQIDDLDLCSRLDICDTVPLFNAAKRMIINTTSEG